MHALNIWAVILGGMAVAVPVAIHLLTRARGRRLLFPTVRFVLEALQARRRWNRLRDILVLALRTAAVLALAAMFARIVTSTPATSSSGGSWAVVVLDVSLSMGARGGESPAFAMAQHAVQQVLAEPGLGRGELILAGQHPRPVFGRLSENLAALREEAARAEPLSEALDATAAITAAAALVQALGPGDRDDGEVVIVSDLQRSSWAAASFASLPPEAKVRIVNARGDAPIPPNAAILRAWSSGMVSVGRQAAVAAEIAHYGNVEAARVLELHVEGQTVQRLVMLRPGERRQESFLVTPSRGGPLLARLRLEGGDALEADNLRSLALRVREGRRAAVVSAERPGGVGTASYFVDRALRAPGEAGFEVERLSTQDLETDQLARFDLLVLVQAGRLPRSAVEGLAKLLARGLPVLYALQAGADAESVAELEAALGPAVRFPVSFAPLDRADTERFLVWADPARRPFRAFGAGLERFTRDLILAGGLRSAARPEAEEGTVLARLSDDSAGLVVLPVQSGRLALLNLPLGGRHHVGKSPLVVPLLQELALDLVEGPERSSLRSGTCGRPFSLPLPAGRGAGGPVAWSVASETGEAADGPRVVEDQGGPLLVWGQPGRPGGYRVLAGDGAVEAFAIGLPSEESDLGSIDAKVLKERIARGRSVSVAGVGDVLQAGRGECETWWAFAVIALLALLLELAVLKAFRS